MTSYPCNKYEQITPSYLLILSFLILFVRMGVPAQFSDLGGTSTIFQPGGTSTIFQPGGTSTIFQSGGTSTIFQSGGTNTIFSTLHGSLWFGKDKGSIMKSTESYGTIH